MIAKEVSGYAEKSRLLQASLTLRVAVPVISTASARPSRVAMGRSISPQSRISRRLAPGGPASHGRPRNAVSPIPSQNRVLRGRQGWSKAARRVNQDGASERRGRKPAIVVTATKAANVFLILALLCVHGVRPRDRRTINDAKKFRPLHVPPAGHCIRSTECIDRGWLRVACCKVPMSVEAQEAKLSQLSPQRKRTDHMHSQQVDR